MQQLDGIHCLKLMEHWKQQPFFLEISILPWIILKHAHSMSMQGSEGDCKKIKVKLLANWRNHTVVRNMNPCILIKSTEEMNMDSFSEIAHSCNWLFITWIFGISRSNKPFRIKNIWPLDKALTWRTVLFILELWHYHQIGWKCHKIKSASYSETQK